MTGPFPICNLSSQNPSDIIVCVQGSIPSPRAAHSVAKLGRQVFLFGGRHDTTRLNDLYLLDMSDFVWTRWVSVVCFLQLVGMQQIYAFVSTDHRVISCTTELYPRRPRITNRNNYSIWYYPYIHLKIQLTHRNVSTKDETNDKTD